MARLPAPWNWNEPVVEKDGKATSAFLAWLRNQIGLNSNLDQTAGIFMPLVTGEIYNTQPRFMYFADGNLMRVRVY